ncbi:MAG TPA: MauE/DoxX family redox-associated membrane protein [Bryobacteraceae bacterium]|nr:MauE/DoxX family redox-associated membrane protein [Bryobacteraceae bacterium]
MPRLIVALRVLLAAVFCFAAYTKLRQPWLVFAMSVDAYRLLPAWAVFGVARTLPWLELAIGLLLLSGLWSKYAAAGATVLLVLFWLAMLRAWTAGAGINCACFGVGEAVSALTLARDAALLACSAVLTFLLWSPNTRLLRASRLAA